MGRRETGPNDSPLRILAVTQGLWGKRIAEYIGAHASLDWLVETWAAPRMLPPIVDDPEEFLPPELPEVDIVLALGEMAGLAQLVPDIARVTKARAVITPIDHNVSLPSGLVRQLGKWLEEIGVAVVFPKPFCSLTESTYNRTPLVTTYQDPIIQRFARHFGRPEFRVTLTEGRIKEVEVVRDSACGCACHVAEKLIGTPVNDAIEEAGMLHHHFPCLASMERDSDYRDTLMHVSGNILKDALQDEIRDHLSVTYIRPSGLVGGSST